MFPDSLLPCRDRVVRFLRVPTDRGIGPSKQLSSICNRCKQESLPMLSGIGPVS
uniref:Uncharacterized protein n=1 Tax=Arundo donax TaxID=35708 RepID=A0A0A9FW42_ARUDO